MPGDNDCLVKLALRANHNHFVAQLITQPLTPSKRIYLGHGTEFLSITSVSLPLPPLLSLTTQIGFPALTTKQSGYRSKPTALFCLVVFLPSDSSLMRLFSTFRSFGPIYQVASNSCHQVL
ncbi:hypothetical protein PCANC_16013 [Puccinia coronata f. sp. avenae]|uniref:Uncharacterized protein n=1 Tax=Puccinia coronata f. sp. avenae TaxID=200324 RepID=A0A2N5VRU3_9BASI|nr:hypothetical protein PCANC_16013 [Puccinia coronata f. sp. avenae]